MTEQNGEGHLQAILDDILVEYGASPTSYYRVALEFARGAQLADTHEKRSLVAVIAANAAHSTELALRAFLLSQSTPVEVRGLSARHDLNKLWAESYKRGCKIESAVPRWCTILNAGHANPYLFRYPQDNTGIVLPDDALEGLRKLLRVVGAALRLHENGNALT